MLTHNLTRTSTFRLTAGFGLICGFSIILLLGLVYQQTAGVLSRRVDHILTAEAEALARTSPEVILSVIRQQAARDPLADFTIFSASGEKVAGNGVLTPGSLPVDGTPRDFELAGSPPLRALAEPLPWGETLVVTRDTSQLVEIRQIVFNAVFWSGGSIAILVSVLAIALSLPSLRRIRETRTASEAIAAGDFTARLPVNGSRDELDELAVIVNVMMDELERLVTEARTVGEAIAHELRTPLTRLRATLDHAANRLEPGDFRSGLLDTCIAETDGVLRRFRGLLRIAAVEASGRRTAIRHMCLSEVVAQAVELFEPLATHKDIVLHAKIEQNVETRGDRELIFEAISNLIDNAIKFSPSLSTVVVDLTQGAMGAELVITDRGPGISEEDRPFVTKRFYRSLEAEAIPGHGLGLSLVAAVADVHGFSLAFEDAKPGTRVRLNCAQS